MTEEQKVQVKITKSLEANGWMVIKLMRTTVNGIPDLMALKDGVSKFIEVKKPGGGVISPLQKYVIKKLRGQGFEAVVMDGVDSIIY